jgi:hypothetical protein
MSIPDRIRKAIRKRVCARDRYHRKHLGRQAKREARLIRGLRRRLLAFTAPRSQYDAVTLANVPKDARAVACYVNGAYANHDEAKRRFPDALITTITVNFSAIGDAADFETGDFAIADGPKYFRLFKAERPHDKPVLYMPASWMPEFNATMRAAGIKKRQYILWSAHWEGKHICGPKTCGESKADGTQWTTHDERVDESKLRPSYWRR